MASGDHTSESLWGSQHRTIAGERPGQQWLPLSSDLGLLTIKGGCFDRRKAERGLLGEQHGLKLPVKPVPLRPSSLAANPARERPRGKGMQLSPLLD